MPKRMYAAGLDPAASEPDLAPSTSSAAESAALEELRVTSIREQWTECSCGAPLEHHELPARVFGTSAIDEVTLVEASCTECGVRAAVDGSEYFILRKGPFSSAPLGTFELCFSWELLNDTMNDLAAEGTFFWTRWKACMKKWDGIDVTAAQLVGWHSLYRHFVTATLDFVTLQALDYKSVLSCKCDDPNKHMVSDALTLAIRRARVHLDGPWLPGDPEPGSGGMAAQFGSEYHARFAIPAYSLRAALRPITTTAAEGWADDELRALEEECHHWQGGNVPDVDRALPPISSALLTLFAEAHRPIVAVGNRLRDHICSFLRDLSANTPACQIAHLIDLAALQRCRSSVCMALAAEDEAAAAEACAAFTAEDQPLCGAARLALRTA